MPVIGLTVYADEAGTHDGSGFTIMAGWVGYAQRWADFDSKWQILLDRNNLPYIHGKDLRQGTGPFKDKLRWPPAKRAELGNAAIELAQMYALFGLSVVLKNSDYDRYYIGADRRLRKHRAAIDSKYGVCARSFISVLAEFIERYAGADGQVHLVLEDGHKNSGAARDILRDFRYVAPDRARFINPHVTYVAKRDSPGVQAADLAAYPDYILERDGRAEIQDIEPGFPDTLPRGGAARFRAAISSDILQGIKSGQIDMAGLRRRFGRHWSQLHGFPRGWSVASLKSNPGQFLLVPPLSGSIAPTGSRTPEPEHSVRLRCL
jgi:hypothetical protein